MPSVHQKNNNDLLTGVEKKLHEKKSLDFVVNEICVKTTELTADNTKDDLNQKQQNSSSQKGQTTENGEHYRCLG